MKKMRIIFMGTPDFSVPSLQEIYDAGYDIAAVFTQPDKQQGRGKKISFSPVKEKAISLGLTVFQPQKIRDEEVIQRITALHPDVIVVIAYGKILPKAVLDIPPYGCLNVHGSLLPKYRGAAPIQYAIKNGDPKSGVTIMQLDEGMDTGPMLKKSELVLDPKETTASLFHKLSTLGASTLLTVLEHLPACIAQAETQKEADATYTSKIEKEMAEINWSQKAAVIERLIRTLDPQPGAYTFFKGKRLKIWFADVVPGTDSAPGTVIHVTKKQITVQTGENALCIREVQPESRNRMTTAQFLQGNTITVGDIL
ncbi:methionyl-tRNA formyltransferase [Megasphaera cerevisiae DSM 20462]|uniref:Methionyl-tRNA formyltransferase n=1 Tax=Megasphaera cerevisiae DSM 20462 TaxID=1122219 RepID=A0A0J6WZ27_9FIRM|nr:methionyl-tRNA formyltransferase [Megasphaera cerevisiae]KMO87909.1 methionyl-tRNA formyltransferase [Megasphaera cerevisiae DSM 20462]SJZ43333.1 methionyl-tRNA formyltransferase [Megasphaera cerevisiae DSM 20462]